MTLVLVRGDMIARGLAWASNIPRPYKFQIVPRPPDDFVAPSLMYKQNPMHMVRHHHERIHRHLRKMPRDRFPTILYDFTQGIQDHPSRHNLPK